MLEPGVGQGPVEVEQGVGFDLPVLILFEAHLELVLDLGQEPLLEDLDLLLGGLRIRRRRGDPGAISRASGVGADRRSIRARLRLRPDCPSQRFRERGRVSPKEKPQPPEVLLGTNSPAVRSGLRFRPASFTSAVAPEPARRAAIFSDGRDRRAALEGSASASCRPAGRRAGVGEHRGLARGQPEKVEPARPRPRVPFPAGFDDAVLETGLLDPGAEDVGVRGLRRPRNGCGRLRSSWSRRANGMFQRSAALRSARTAG